MIEQVLSWMSGIKALLSIIGLGEAAVIAILLRIIKKMEKRIWKLEEEAKQFELANQSQGTIVERYKNAVRLASGDELSLWGRPIGARPGIDDYDRRMRESIPIMLFANLKGGVGKTTIAANIGAYFAHEKGERVLLIDLDYQGSLSGLCLAQAGTANNVFPSISERFIRGEAVGQQVLDLARRIGADAPKLDFIPAFYPFETAETRLMFEWFLNERDEDIRYNLAGALLSDEVQKHYKRIILDGPPRLTTGLINALCASTHLFVPTVLDALSAETVASFAGKLDKLKGRVCPRLQFAGIIGTMTPQVKLSKEAKDAADRADAAVRRILGGGPYFLDGAVIRRSRDISNSTDAGIGYLKSANVQKLFDPLGQAIAKRVSG